MALVDAVDFQELSKWRWRKTSHGYIARGLRVNGKQKQVYMHRHIMSPERGMVVDHKNGNGLDNRRSNLRVCTQAQNVANSRMKNTNTSGFKGVCWSEPMQKWVARLTVDYKQVVLGYATSKRAAYRMYVNALRQAAGEYANLKRTK